MLVLDETIKETRTTKITAWYREVFPKVAAYIQKRGGSIEDAKEIFQEALVVYYEKRVKNFRPEVSESAYLMGTVKKLWLRQTEKRTGLVSIENIEYSQEDELKPVTEKMLHFLKQSGEKCMDLLQSFYYEKLSMGEVADRFGYKSERSATVQKFKCLEKVRSEVKQKSLSYEDFVD